VKRIESDAATSALEGRVCWSPAKSIWITSMTSAALLIAPIYVSWSAVALFVVTSGVTLCFGHSVGMHRKLIHDSFQCPKWLEYLCVYLGTLVGMAGPLGMVEIHDFRDWAQRQDECHDYFCHRKSFWLDAWWQLHCELGLTHPPRFRLEHTLAEDRFYKFLERSWMLQQLPWAVLFFALGGLPWLVWGVAVRVAVCVTGHWLVGHLAHREGSQDWVVEGAAAQGYNVSFAGLISIGESWHNNHHAFPESARLGLLPHQTDLGWTLIKAFERFGLASHIVTPETMPHRAELKSLASPAANARADGRHRLAFR
jgi:stearoyl-CoA desaturase (delta-9 desaturase)